MKRKSQEKNREKIKIKNYKKGIAICFDIWHNKDVRKRGTKHGTN